MIFSVFRERGGGHPLVLLCSFLLLIIVPFITKDNFLLHVIILANVYVVLSAAWDICSGYLGEVNLGHAAFFGLGAYTVAYFDQWFQLPPWISTLIGGGVACVFSLFIGFTSLTLKRDYFVIVSIAFAQILWSIASTWSSVTGGEEGIRHISNFSPKVIFNYFLALALMVVCIAILYAIVKSRLGRILLAIHEDEYASKAAGLNTSVYKILTFGISSFLAGLIGGFYAHYLGIVTPESLSLGVTFNVMAMTFVGGSTTIFGPIVGAYIITFLAQYLYFFMDYRLITQSLALLLIVLFFPGGLIRLIFKSAYR
jgi:branched-chain amino acid transport system permease protein